MLAFFFLDKWVSNVLQICTPGPSLVVVRRCFYLKSVAYVRQKSCPLEIRSHPHKHPPHYNSNSCLSREAKDRVSIESKLASQVLKMKWLQVLGQGLVVKARTNSVCSANFFEIRTLTYGISSPASLYTC